MLQQYYQDDYIVKLESRINKLEQNFNHECPICMEKIGKDGYTKLKCGHMVDIQCFVTMCKNNMNLCPLCRDVIYEKDEDSDSDSDEEIDTPVVERNIESLLTFEYQTLGQLHEEYNYAFDEISISALQVVLEEYMLGVDIDEEGYRLEPPNPTPPPTDHNVTAPERITYTMEDLYPRFTTIQIFQILERVVEGMNQESDSERTFYAQPYLRDEYNVKYPDKSLNEDTFTTILHYLVVEKVLEQDEYGFYRKVNQ